MMSVVVQVFGRGAMSGLSLLWAAKRTRTLLIISVRLIGLQLTPKRLLGRAEIAMTSIAERSELELHRCLGKLVG
jgi:hypothetical protein